MPRLPKWSMQVGRPFPHPLSSFTMQCTDEEWDVVCQRYEEELAGLKVLRRNVTQTLSKLRREAEKLQREDEVIRDQEEKLRQGYGQLQEKHGQYCAKGETYDPPMPALGLT
jgi:chromosome segregation ATPase